MNRKMAGVLLSYALLAIDILVGIVFVPFLLGTLGEGEYGLYKLMLSTASYLSVLDFGIGSTITRYVVKFRAENNKAEEENFAAMGLAIYGVLSAIVLGAAGIITGLLPDIYRHSVAAEQIRYAQLLFILICTNTSVNLFNHAYHGLLAAHERFIYTKSVNIVKICLRVGLIIIGVHLTRSAIVIVAVDLLLSVAVLLVHACFTRFSLKCCIKLHRWDKKLLGEAFVFTFAILMQSIINQFNSNVDNIVLGIFTTTGTVAVYSVALQLFTMYSSLSTAVSSIYLPSVSMAVFQGADDIQVTRKVIEPSRIQLVILLLAFTGFMLFGREFIALWVGEQYMEVYMIAMVLMGSATLELSQNSITSVLKAKNKLHGKTMILMISTLVNTVITVILVPRMGMMGAALGTAFSMIFGYGVGLNIYYQKKAGIKMGLYYRETYKGIVKAAALAVVIGIGLMNLPVLSGWLAFFLKAVLYACAYAVFMLLFGLNQSERELIGRMLHKVRGGINK